jgi:pyruvate,water dikinase
VSAAFYHGGRLAGILAVLSEALKGIAAVLIARAFFPTGSGWEMIALIALLMGRYWFGRGAGTTNVVWGYVVHDPIAAGLVFLIGGIGFTILRERQQGRISILVLFPVITALRHPEAHFLIGAAVALALLLGWIYMKIPDDLDLEAQAGQSESRAIFKFFRGDRGVRTLDDALDGGKVGRKAATLAHLKRSGYPVPMGWVLLPGDDPEPLLNLLQPSPRSPLIVRSSAIGEDEATASAAGQYETIPNITDQADLQPAIHRCLASYHAPAAIQYRRDRGLPEAAMAVLIQQQVQGSFSGVAFSRDPITRQGDAVVLEALPGNANRVVSGQVTPESYRVCLSELSVYSGNAEESTESNSWVLPDEVSLPVEGEGDVPQRLIQQVAFLARHLEAYYHGIPQDIEWSYDGQALWLLQSRPITTLLPIRTRKIAAEVIPGVIRPLTWSINRPLTCGVWGKLFTLVLGNRSRGLDFNETATLHYSRAYFNASLLGSIFRRMGLPPESLEFLTRGAKFSKPPTRSTLQNLPGLLRLLKRELRLEKDFQRDYQQQFAPGLATLDQSTASRLSAPELLTRIDTILELLQTATYYSILAPLSASLRKAISKVSDDQIDHSDSPEVAALRELQELARETNQENGEKQTQFDRILERYGYLSEVGTDIAIPTWREDPQPVQELLTQFCLNPPPVQETPRSQSRKVRRVQQRFRLKGKVTEVYSRLLAELRWSFVALEQSWLETGLLQETGDIFFLEFQEIRHLVDQEASPVVAQLAERIRQRREQLERDRQIDLVPYLVYGDDPPQPVLEMHNWQASERLQGIAASPGQVEGRVKIVLSLQTVPDIDRDTILVVPYTDSGWAPLLARAGGLIAEVGGRLSHGAIVAREYRIPAVMDVHNATQRLRNGQLVRLDGQQGIVEIL